MSLNSTEELLDAFRRESMVVLLDGDNDELGGVVMSPAETTTAAQINFMARHARGLICLALTPARCEQLRLPLMVPNAGSRHRGNFTVSIEAAEGVSTGISAADRALTVKAAVAADAEPRHLVQPGHVFPLRAAHGGLLKRAGHTEGGCDLARLAGFEPAAVFADVLNDDGSLAKGAQLIEFAARHQLPVGSIADLIDYRLHHETTVERIRSGSIDTLWGRFELQVFRDREDDSLHLALIRGEIRPELPCLVRVQSVATLRDAIGTVAAGGGGWSLPASLRRIDATDHGVLVLLGHTEAPDDLLRSVDFLLGQADAQGRTYTVYHTIGLGSQILRQVGVGKMRLLGKPIRYNAISGFGLEVVEYLSDDDSSGQETADAGD